MPRQVAALIDILEAGSSPSPDFYVFLQRYCLDHIKLNYLLGLWLLPRAIRQDRCCASSDGFSSHAYLLSGTTSLSL